MGVLLREVEDRPSASVYDAIDEISLNHSLCSSVSVVEVILSSMEIAVAIVDTGVLGVVLAMSNGKVSTSPAVCASSESVEDIFSGIEPFDCWWLLPMNASSAVAVARIGETLIVLLSGRTIELEQNEQTKSYTELHQCRINFRLHILSFASKVMRSAQGQTGRCASPVRLQQMTEQAYQPHAYPMSSNVT